MASDTYSIGSSIFDLDSNEGDNHRAQCTDGQEKDNISLNDSGIHSDGNGIEGDNVSDEYGEDGGDNPNLLKRCRNNM